MNESAETFRGMPKQTPTGRSEQRCSLSRSATPYSLLLLSLLVFASTAHAQVFGDIRVSRIGSAATVEIEFGCAMRYLEHRQSQGGTELIVQLLPGQDCRLALSGIRSDLRRPMSGRLAHLSEVEFMRSGNTDASLIVRFDRATAFDVKQTPNLHMLTIEVDREAAANPVEATPTVAATPAVPTEEISPLQNRSSTRQVHDPAAGQQNKFVIRVMKWTPGEEINYELLEPFRSNVIYTNEISLGERRWSELKLGFFDSEAAAEQTLEELSANFSLAWITTANSLEQAAARENQLVWPKDEPVVVAQATATAANEATSIADAEIDGLMEQARTALLRREYAESIDLYTRLLREPSGGHRQQAREFLGVALQKNEQNEQARAEFTAYLEEFPEGSDAKRVQQRLAALAATDGTDPSSSATTAVASNSANPPRRKRSISGWEFYGSAAQYYLRDVNISEGSDDDLVAQSGMLSQAHLVATRRGERFDLTARANLGYLYDLEGIGAEQQALTSYAFLDIADTQTDISLRLGRQQQLASGLLSRFDGLHASYQYRPDITLNVTAGFPVDSSRFLSSSDHYAYGTSVDFNNLLGDWDFSVYANQQMIDGIKDRQAFGTQAMFQNERFTVVGLLDYDLSYAVINAALINASWRAHDRITLHGRARSGVAPFLTTRNAIIGQQVNTLRELFDTYTEGEIRRLARDRTPEETFASGGLSAALTPRLQLRLDASYLKYSAAVASGGVGVFPESGPQYEYGGHLQASGFFKPGQITQFGYRHTETRSIDRDTVWIDVRYPISDQLRLQTRLSYSNRVANQNPAGDIDQAVFNPLLRLVYSGSQRYRIEFEAGGQMSNQEFPLGLAPPLAPDATLEQTDYYLQLGYILDF